MALRHIMTNAWILNSSLPILNIERYMYLTLFRIVPSLSMFDSCPFSLLVDVGALYPPTFYRDAMHILPSPSDSNS